mgnify:CR=1 FL=1
MSVSSKKVLCISMLVAIISGCTAFNKKPVLVLVRTESKDLALSLEHEVNVITNSLDSHALAYKLASPAGGVISAEGIALKTDLRFADVRIEDYSAFVVPCMGSGKYPVPQKMVDILKKANTAHKVIAAQHSEELFWPANLGLYVNTAKSPGVVVDGTIITSYNAPLAAGINHKPADTEALIAALDQAIKK